MNLADAIAAAVERVQEPPAPAGEPENAEAGESATTTTIVAETSAPYRGGVSE